MADIEIVSYILVFLMGIIFSLITLAQQERSYLSSICSFISWICWYTLGGFHLAFLYDSVFLVVCWVYFGVGTVFLIYAFALIFLYMIEATKVAKAKRQAEEMAMP